MMSEPIHVCECADHLAQGDIFCQNLVAPFADPEIRIFRTVRGRHGSGVFDGEPGRIFSDDDLRIALDNLTSEQRVMPFHPTDEGLDEMVVVYADLLRYFIVASQTCDVSGVDSSPKPFATVLPFVTLEDYITRVRLPIGLSAEEAEDAARWTTIKAYLEGSLNADFTGSEEDPFLLPQVVRNFLRDREPSNHDKTTRQVLKRIRSALTEATNHRKLFIYYLPSAPRLKVPEGFVDFCRTYTLPIETLRTMTPERVAAIASPYREEFARKLGDFLSRIATPSPLVPPAS